MNYYYADARNQPVGPIPAQHLHALARGGVIDASTQVILEGSSEWVEYGSLDGAFIPTANGGVHASGRVNHDSTRGAGVSSSSFGVQRCPFCAEEISAQAKKCKHCGETVDVALRVAEEAKRANSSQPMVFMNAGGGAAAAAASGGGLAPAIGTKSRGTAALLAFLFGGIGVHKFYLGQTGMGVVYLLFCWTLVPALVSIIEGLIYLLMSRHQFAVKYG